MILRVVLMFLCWLGAVKHFYEVERAIEWSGMLTMNAPWPLVALLSLMCFYGGSWCTRFAMAEKPKHRLGAVLAIPLSVAAYMYAFCLIRSIL